jgi:hypothetical protein
MLKKSAIGAAVVTAATLSATLPVAADHHSHRTTVATQHVITISCYRGPWEGVIWDRPNPIFIDSLVAAGYSFPEAHAIAERVCRDQGGVGSPETMRAAMSNILATNPPGR